MLVTAIRHDTYENSLIVNPEVTDPGWVDLTQGVFHEANMLTGIEIEIGAGKLALGGLVDRQSDYNVLILRIEQFMADSGLEFINRVGIRPAVALVLPEWTPSPPGEFQEATDSDNLPASEHTPAQAQDVMISPATGDLPKYMESRPIGDAVESASISTQEEPRNVQNSISRRTEDAISIEICQEWVNTALNSKKITFPANVAVIPVEYTTLIDKLGLILSICSTFSILVEGHTDSSGNEDSNILLSKLRAESVMKQLQVHGVDAFHMTSNGFGSSHPVATNQTRKGRRSNRRIEISLGGG
jgi:outer membrane protein OmpA-like peptidoglycan-associated protein